MKRLATGLVCALALQACATGEDPDAAFKLVPVGDGVFLLSSDPAGAPPDTERMVNGMIGAEAHCGKTNQTFETIPAQVERNGQKFDELHFKCVAQGASDEK